MSAKERFIQNYMELRAASGKPTTREMAEWYWDELSDDVERDLRFEQNPEVYAEDEEGYDEEL